MDSMKTGPMNLFAGQQWRHTYREQTCARGGRKVKVGSVQRMTWKHTLSCVKQISSGHLPCDSGDAKQGSVTTNTGKATQRHQLLETCESKLPWGYHLTLLRKAIIKKKKKNLQPRNAEGGVEIKEPCYPAYGMFNWSSHHGNITEAPQK